MPDSGQNYENWSESGPYVSVRADTPSESIPQGLGCLWNASRTPKPLKNQKIQEIREIPENPGISLFSPIPLCGGLAIFFPCTVALGQALCERFERVHTAHGRCSQGFTWH